MGSGGGVGWRCHCLRPCLAPGIRSPLSEVQRCSRPGLPQTSAARDPRSFQVGFSTLQVQLPPTPKDWAACGGGRGHKGYFGLYVLVHLEATAQAQKTLLMAKPPPKKRHVSEAHTVHRTPNRDFSFIATEQVSQGTTDSVQIDYTFGNCVSPQGVAATYCCIHRWQESRVQIYVPPLQHVNYRSHGTHMLYLDCRHDPVRLTEHLRGTHEPEQKKLLMVTPPPKKKM